MSTITWQFQATIPEVQRLPSISRQSDLRRMTSRSATIVRAPAASTYRAAVSTSGDVVL